MYSYTLDILFEKIKLQKSKNKLLMKGIKKNINR